MLKKFPAVIFDMDGLLLDSEPVAKKAFDTVCQQYGLGDLSDTFMQLIGTNTEKGNAVIKQALDDSIDGDEFNKTWRALYTSWVHDKAIPLQPGVKDILDYLQALNIPMAVATSSQTDISLHKLSLAGIVDYFEVVIGGDQVTKSKPEPDIYLKAAASLACEPNRCLAFEDSSNGVKAAVAAGMTVVQIPDLVKPNEELLSLGHIVLERISDAINFDFELVSEY